MLQSRCRGLAAAAGLVLACSSAALAQSRGPDVIVGTLYTPAVWGTAGGYTAYSVGTFSCNAGDTILKWIAGTNEHPVIGQNLFRYTTTANGGSRFEHIGQSWLKHGFTALQGAECAGDIGFPYAYHTANPAGGVGLGLGASDPYSASLNGGQSSAGPKGDVNATTGVFQYPPSLSGGTPTDLTWRRLRVANADIVAGSRYFYEGQYVALDDCATGNRNNSVSWVETTLANNENLAQSKRGEAAIQAWPSIDAQAKVVPIDVPGDGRFWLGWRVTPIGNPATQWEYEYAIQNLNSDRSGGSFTVPTGGATISSQGARYVEYHSGEIWSNTPWTSSVTGSAVAWNSPATFASNPNTNALRWGTLYNFRFIANQPPARGSVSLGLFKPGSGQFAGLNQMIISADVPGGATLAGAAVNDACASAVAMYGEQVGFSTAGASSAGPDACVSSIGKSPASNAIDNDLWFTFVAPCTSTLSATTCGSNFDTRLAVYSTCPGASGAPLACNDDDAACGAGSTQSRVSFAVTAGATYLFRVGGYMGAVGNGVITITNGCPVGACCNSSNICQVITATACATMCHSYGGNNSTCTTGICATFSGACCNATSGACTSGAASSCCTSGGLYQGHGTSCSPSPCPGAGKCCNTSTGACTLVLQGACTGTWSSATSCSLPCPGTGACCASTGACSFLLQSGCTAAGGVWNGSSVCSPNPCPAAGACCNTFSGACTLVIQTSCGAGSTWNGSSACSPNPCPAAQVPANDLCANAIALYDGIPFTGSNTLATTDYPGSAALNCGSGNSSGRDVWFRYTPALSGNVRVTTDNNAGSGGGTTNFDTVVSVHSACGTTGVTILACDDDSGNTPGNSSNIAAVNLTANVTYLIRMAGYGSPNPATGTYTIRVIGGGATPPVPPSNDNCADRQGVGVGIPIVFNTAGATTDGPIPTGCSMTQIDRDIWYNYPAQTTGILTVSTCGSSFDTRIAVYRTSVCAGITDANLIACNDNFACAGGGTTQSQLSINVEQGTSYTIRIGGTSNAGGAGSMLLSVVSTIGGCCDTFGACHNLTQGDCNLAGGTFMGVGQACSPNPCAQPPQPGACCTPATGGCVSMLQTSCPQGNTFVSGGVCLPNPCPQPGACCNPADGVCQFVVQTACAGPRTFAPGVCTPNPCAQPGSCCAENGGCSRVLQAACTAGVFTAGGVCTPNPCPQPGACCTQSTGACAQTLPGACVAPSTFMAAATCTPTNPCPQPPQPGACCTTATGACAVALQADCIGAVTFIASGACNPNPCPQPPTGACCNGTTCSTATQAGCSGTWQGPASACGVTGNPTTCCPANFDGQGGVVVQDIFVFLTAWFANGPGADFNRDMSINVADIFAFLGAWFAGC